MNDGEYMTILEAADEAVIVASEDERIIFFNQGAEQMFGYADDEALGEPLGMLMPERYRETHSRHLQWFAKEPAITRKMNERGQIRGLRKNGEEFEALASILKTRSAGGRLHFSVIMRDISLLVAVADHLQRKIAILEEQNRALAQSRNRSEHTEYLLERLLEESHSRRGYDSGGHA